MSSGNIFMAIGAVIILSFLSLTINNAVLGSKDESSASERLIAAQGILQQLSEEIRNKPYDLAVLADSTAAPTSFATPASLDAIAQANAGIVLTHQALTSIEASLLQTSADSLTPSTGDPISVSTTNAFPTVNSYNGCTLQYSTPRAGDYSARTSVAYVDPASPTTPATVATRVKRISITVTNPFMKDTLVTSFLVSH